jgi:hypothetical protein
MKTFCYISVGINTLKESAGDAFMCRVCILVHWSKTKMCLFASMLSAFKQYYNLLTERHVRMASTPALHFGVPGFKLRPENLLAWLRCLIIFHSSYREMAWPYLKLVTTKLSLALLIVLVQLRRCIKIHTSKAFVSSSYSNPTCFGPTGHHQVYKL